MNRSINSFLNRLINQSFDYSVNQSTDQSNQSIIQPKKKQSFNQGSHRSVQEKQTT